jgi:hypothetical protein
MRNIQKRKKHALKSECMHYKLLLFNQLCGNDS